MNIRLQKNVCLHMHAWAREEDEMISFFLPTQVATRQRLKHYPQIIRFFISHNKFPYLHDKAVNFPAACLNFAVRLPFEIAGTTLLIRTYTS